MILKKGKQFEKDFLITWKNRNSFGHWYLEFEICLEFDA